MSAPKPPPEPMMPLPVSVKVLQEGDWFALDPVEIGTGGWLIVEPVQTYSNGDLIVRANDPYGAGAASTTFTFKPDAHVILCDGNDLRMQMDMLRKALQDEAINRRAPRAGDNPRALRSVTSIASITPPMSEVDERVLALATTPVEREAHLPTFRCTDCGQDWVGLTADEHARLCTERPFWPAPGHPKAMDPWQRLCEMQVLHDLADHLPQPMGLRWLQDAADSTELQDEEWVPVWLTDAGWTPLAAPTEEPSPAWEKVSAFAKATWDETGVVPLVAVVTIAELKAHDQAGLRTIAESDRGPDETTG